MGGAREFQKKIRPACRPILKPYHMVPGDERKLQIAFKYPALRADPRGLISEDRLWTWSPELWTAFGPPLDRLCSFGPPLDLVP